MGFAKEFKEFILRGNVMDLAVGVIIGGAFGKIISSLVSDVIMPPIGALIGGISFTEIKIKISDAVLDGTGKIIKEAVTLNIGNFLQTMVDFTIIAFAIFLMIKGINKLNKKKEEVPAPPEPTREEKLLTEIRDILKTKS